MALSAYFSKVPLLHMIEDLLAAATAHDPEARPDMTEFQKTLEDWLEKAGNFEHESLGDWGALQSYLFPVVVPHSAAWYSPEDIVSILNLLGQHAELNHTFSPDGGGLDLKGAAFSVEQDCIELHFSLGVSVVLKPRVLLFESFPGFTEWAYFRLETNELAPSSAYKSVSLPYEEVLEASPGEYMDRAIYDQGCLGWTEGGESIPLPQEARIVTRQFRGSFVVFAKASPYNEMDNYQGDHNRLDASAFRAEVERVVRDYGQKIRDAKASRRKN